MTFIKLEIVLDYRHSIRFTSGFLGNRFWDSKKEVYWEVPSGTTSVWGDGGRDGQREKSVCDVVVTEASAWAGWSFWSCTKSRQEAKPLNIPMDAGCHQTGGITLGEAASLSRGQFLESDSAVSCANKRLSPEGASGQHIPAPPRIRNSN